MAATAGMPSHLPLPLLPPRRHFHIYRFALPPPPAAITFILLSPLPPVASFAAIAAVISLMPRLRHAAAATPHCFQRCEAAIAARFLPLISRHHELPASFDFASFTPLPLSSDLFYCRLS